MSDATSTKHYAECVAEAAAKVEQSLGKADIGIVLGSGLGHFSSLLKDPQSLGYEEIPHMPKPNVVGHQGRLYIGSIGNHRVLCFSGRVHAYEGYDMYVVSFFAQLSAALGCKIFMATNAAGAVPDARVGDFVVITDHLNFYKRNTLVDTCLDASLGERNLNTTNLYSERLQKLAFETAARLDCRIHQGVYMASMGPTYETHAEVKAGVKLGAKLFGMSTVPEISAGKSLGMEVFAMSLCTNLAAGMSEEILSHNDVTDAAEASKEAIMRFVEQFISAIDIDPNFVVKPNNPEGVKSSNIALPQVAPKASTQEDVDAAVAFLKGNGVEKVGALVSVAPVLESSFVKDHFEIKNAFALTDLPHFPVYSLSGREGQIAFGLHRGTGQSVLLLLNQAIEGFSIEEATFLVEISASLSATQLFFFSESSALSDQAKAADFLVIEDAANWTSIHGVSHLRPIFQQQLSNNVFSSVEGEGLKKGSVFQYDGPSFPTAIEVELAKKIEADVVSLTDLSLVYVANQIGFSIIGASIPTSSFPGFERISFCAEKSARISASLSSLFSSPAPASLRPLEGLVSTPFVSSFQVRTTLEKPVTQGSYEKYEESVAELKKVLAEGKVRNTFVVNSPFESLVEKLVGKTEITQSVPHLPEGQRLFLGRFSEADATTHLFLVQPLVLSQGFKPDVIAFSSRVVAAVTEENVVIVGAHVAVDEALVGGDVVVLTDHVNFTGRNGLCGHNEGRWGLRFFDMSDQYFKSLISSIQSASEAEQIVAKKVVTNYSVGPIVKSKLDKSFAKLVGAQTITTTGVLEAAVLQHMRRDLPFRIASVGVCLADWTGDQVNTSFSLDDASSKLISIFRHL